jgi:hypothetical protein
MIRRHWFKMFAICIAACFVGNVATACESPNTVPRSNSKMSVDEQIAGNLAQDLELQMELHRDGDSLELRYHIANHGKEAVILVNFLTRIPGDRNTDLNPSMAELQADGILKISQRVLDEGSPPSSIRPNHTYTLLSPGKTREHSIKLAPNQVFWDIHGAKHIPLPNAKKIVLCLGVIPASSTYLELTEGEPKVTSVGGQILPLQTLLCSQPMAMK